MIRISGVYFLIGCPTGMSCTFCVIVNFVVGHWAASVYYKTFGAFMRPLLQTRNVLWSLFVVVGICTIVLM